MLQATVIVSVSREFTASAEAIFDAWLNPQKARKFLFATPTGVMKTVEIDPRVGGKFCIIEVRNGVDAEHVGQYLEIDRPQHLRFSFGGNPFPATNVMLNISESESGCVLYLVHEGVWAEYEASVIQGWTDILENLAQLV
ncbi:SRPBCC family protein [Undibacterium sp. Di24W]|uniref:SRPBCC family protein n=1 Tax=Undibacterium sp. Di24W TaxID=3413033 RepID=UPI003BEFC980